MSRQTIQVAVALVHRGPRWLVARRRPDAHLGGLWEFPGGKREPGERSTETALRELREERGVRAVAERVLSAVFHEYPDRSVNITPVICRWLSGQTRPRDEESCRWVTLAELRWLEMPAVNAEIIRQLEQMS